MKSGQQVFKVPMTTNKMFPLEVSSMDHLSLITTEKKTSMLCHQRYGHLNSKGLKLLNQKNMVQGLASVDQIALCEGCIYGKQSRRSFPSGASQRASTKLELIHADVCGPMQTTSLGGNRYFLLFTDDYTQMNWVYFLKFKSQVFNCFQKFKVLVEKQCGRPIKILRSDRVREFLSSEFRDFCDDNGIKRHLTAPYTPEQNGVMERKNRTVVEMARCLLKEKGLPNDLWAEAVATAVYLLNLSPTKAVQNKTPFEAWSEICHKSGANQAGS